jgi:hypothetical protein
MKEGCVCVVKMDKEDVAVGTSATMLLEHGEQTCMSRSVVDAASLGMTFLRANKADVIAVAFSMSS